MHFPFEKLPFLNNLKYDYFIYEAETSFHETLVFAQLKYCPGAYLVIDFSEDKLSEILYVGESGFKNGKLVEQQLPVRLLNASCDLPSIYPPCQGKTVNIKRAEAWCHMMAHDQVKKVAFFLFYSNMSKMRTKVTCEPTPLDLQNRIITACRNNNQLSFRWSSSK